MSRLPHDVASDYRAILRRWGSHTGCTIAGGTLQPCPIGATSALASRITDPIGGPAVTVAEDNEVKVKSATDTATRISRLQLRTEKARVLARPEPPMIPIGTSLREALEQMRERSGEALLIADGRRLAGILTERDVLTRILGKNVDESRPVDEYMTTTPHTIAADATLIEAMQAMEQGHFRNLPLVDESGNVVGLLRQQDLLGYVAEAFPQEILNLPPRPHQQMEEQEGA